MFTKKEKMSLENIGEGVAIEKFNKCLDEVLDNIVDPNTKPDGVREVVLNVKIKPAKDRGIGNVEVSVKAKLVSDDAFTTSCFIGSAGKKGEAHELDNGQRSFFDDPTNVVDINTGTK
jgi:hypothetical protein